jgi:hypothetical protein
VSVFPEPWAIRWVAYHLDHEEAALGDRGALHARALSGTARALRRDIDGHRLGVLADLRRALVSAYRLDRLERFVEALAAYAEEERTARGALARWGRVRDDETALLAMLDEVRRDDVSAALLARASAAWLARGAAVPSSFRDRLAALRPQLDSAYVSFARAILPREVAESVTPLPEWLAGSVTATSSGPAFGGTLALEPARLDAADPAGLAFAALVHGSDLPPGTTITEVARALLGAATEAERAAPNLDAWLTTVSPSSDADRELRVRAMTPQLSRAWHAHGGDPVGWFVDQLEGARSDYHGVLSRVADALAACAELLGEPLRAARAILDRAKVMEERRYATNVVRTVPRLLLASADDLACMDALLEETLLLEASSISPANLDFVAFPIGLRSAALGDVNGWKRALESLTSAWLRGEVIVQAPDAALRAAVISDWLPLLTGNVLAFHRALRRIVVARTSVATHEEVLGWVAAAGSEHSELLVESLRALAEAAIERDDAAALAKASWSLHGAALAVLTPTMRRRALAAVALAKFDVHEPGWATLGEGEGPTLKPRRLSGTSDLAACLTSLAFGEHPADTLVPALASVLTVAPGALAGCGDDVIERLVSSVALGPVTRWSVIALLHLSAAAHERRSATGVLVPSGESASAAHALASRLAVLPETLQGSHAEVFDTVDAWPDVLGFVANRPGADVALASALGHPLVAAGFRHRLAEFRELDLSRPSAMVDGLGRRVSMRLAVEFLSDSFTVGGSMAEMRPIAERLTSLAVAHHATQAELEALHAKAFGGVAA